MRTDLLLSRETAGQLFPLSHQATHGHSHETFTTYFNKYCGGVRLTSLGCVLEPSALDDRFFLWYDHYLAEVPSQLTERGIVPIGAKLTRTNNAPTRARAGFYRSDKHHATASVERVFPRCQDSAQKLPPLFVQNITVTASTLAAANAFNTLVSTGSANRFLVNAWE
jgi:hypothetical protein